MPKMEEPAADFVRGRRGGGVGKPSGKFERTCTRLRGKGLRRRTVGWDGQHLKISTPAVADGRWDGSAERQKRGSGSGQARRTGR